MPFGREPFSACWRLKHARERTDDRTVRPLPTHVAPRREAAFTILELVIGMILLGLAIGVVGQVVIQAVGGGAGARAGAVSDGAVYRAASMLADDVAAANTEHRRDNLLRDPTDLAGALQRNEVPYSSDPARPGMRLDIDEVVRATPTELQIRADVDRAVGVECVTWRAVTAGGFQLRRMVGPACGSASLSDRVLLESSNPAAAGIDTTPFAYRLVCSRRDCPNTGAPSGSECQPWIVENRAVRTEQRRWVIGVDAKLGVVSEGAAAGGTGSMRIAIRSRDTETYRRGLGC